MSDDEVDDIDDVDYVEDADDIDDEDYIPETQGVRRSGRSRRSRVVFPTFVDITDHTELIEIVKEYDLLYNPKNQWYSDNLRKERAWKEISSIINIPDLQCKKAWSNLRDSFRRNYKKRKEAEANGQPVKPWKYDKDMEFLTPFIKFADKALEAFSFISTDTIDTTTAFNSDAVEVQVEADDDIDEEEPTQFVSLDKSDTDTPKQPVKRQMIEHEKNEEEEKQTNVRSREESDYESPKQPVKRKKIQEHKEPEPIVVIQRTKVPSPVTTMIPSSTTTTKSSHDEIDMFFSCIAATVKQFSPLSKAMAKSRVFAVISEMEMMEISKNESK